MWRDRTNLFISYRQSCAHHPAKKPNLYPSSSSSRRANYNDDFGTSTEERRGLISPGAFDDISGDAVIEMDILPPRWADISDEVTVLLSNIAAKSQALEKLHQKHVLPGFDDEDVKKREEVDIERLTQEITRGFHECQKAIARIQKMVDESRARGQSSKAEEVMARNIQISLAGRVQDVSAEFRKKQSVYLKKLRALSGMSAPAVLSGTSTPLPMTNTSLLESDADASYSRTTLSQTQTQRQLQAPNDTAIIQREREINEIATGIIELADIFRELQGMVIDQGSMLDRIDYNVENMAVDVKAADKELKVASGYQRKGTKRRLILLLILLVVGMFILLMVKPKRQKEAPRNNETPS